VVVGASNSGRTKEIVSFMEGLADHYRNVFRVGLTSNPSTPLEATCDFTHVLACGAEQAVAATKSVVEQGLFYYSLLHLLGAAPADAAKLRDAAAGLEYALTASVPAEMLAAVENASCVYWCGRNNGVAEELTLKTNEVIRRRADYLEGTYAFHGIEDAMDRGETVVLIDPEAEYVPKFQERLGRGAGVDLVAIAHRETGVPTLVLPEAGDLNGFLQMAAGWNLLVEVGIRQGVNLDKPERARKVGLEAGK
jgi:glucosamine--fructose-6-phosphate aminotransferase (isomerizing)